MSDNLKIYPQQNTRIKTAEKYNIEEVTACKYKPKQIFGYRPNSRKLY